MRHNATTPMIGWIFRCLPYELFLYIVEIFIADARANAEHVVWCLEGVRHGTETLFFINGSLSRDGNRSLRRANSIRNIAQVNRKASEMVCRKFTPFRQMNFRSGSWGLAPRVWVCSDIDLFCVSDVLQAGQYPPVLEALMFWSVQPRRSSDVLRHVKKILILEPANLQCLQVPLPSMLAFLSTLPNLEAVVLSSPKYKPPWRPGHSRKHQAQILPIDPELFPFLTPYADPLQYRQEEFWRKPVRLLVSHDSFVLEGSRWSCFMEVARTSHGLLMKFCSPQCRCHEEPIRHS